MAGQILDYQTNKDSINGRIKNLAALPRGTGAKFLLTIRGEGTDLVAKQWKRKQPAKLAGNEVLIKF